MPVEALLFRKPVAKRGKYPCQKNCHCSKKKRYILPFVNQSGGRHTYCIRTGKGFRQRPVPRSKGVSTAKVPVTPRTIYQDFTRGGSVPLRESLNFGLINVILIDARENGRFFHCSDLIIPGSECQKAGKQCSTSDPSNKSRNENKVGMVWVRRA